MITKKILQEYKKQNPQKYHTKFGNVDPETLEGVIGMTQPSERELEMGIKPKAIWKEYDLGYLRSLGGVTIVPAPLVTQANHFMPAPVQAPVAPAPTVAPVVEEKKEPVVETENNTATTAPEKKEVE